MTKVWNAPIHVGHSGSFACFMAKYKAHQFCVPDRLSFLFKSLDPESCQPLNLLRDISSYKYIAPDDHYSTSIPCLDTDIYLLASCLNTAFTYRQILLKMAFYCRYAHERPEQYHEMVKVAGQACSACVVSMLHSSILYP